jgi:hypothetical protein
MARTSWATAAFYPPGQGAHGRAPSRVKAPLRAFDGLPGNQQVLEQHERIYVGFARWLLRGPRPMWQTHGLAVMREANMRRASSDFRFDGISGS